MKESWDERFARDEYIYGKEPNLFFAQTIDKLGPGKILFLGEGEGRNAVHAAKSGWDVHAIDGAPSGKEKADKLAAENNVTINYEVMDLNDFNSPENEYDAVVLIFLHLEEKLRIKTHQNAIKALKPGGKIILEVFDKEQIKNSSGGPKSIKYLYSLEEIFSDFQDLELNKFEKKSKTISEGPKHQGIADTITLIATKN